jgi:hypothetical protein
VKYLSTATGNVVDGSGTYDYRANSNCRWYIQPTGASVIHLHFNEFDIKAGDFLRVSNATTGAILANLSGDTLPADMICNTEKVLLYFRSYDNGAGDGFSVSYYNATGIESFDESSIVVYPNPFAENIIIEGFQPNEAYNIEILSLDGRLVLSSENVCIFDDSKKTINTSSLCAGAYILNVQGPAQRFVRKLIKY